MLVSETVFRTLRKNKTSKVKMIAVYDKPVKAPIKKGDKLGIAKFQIPNQPEFSVPLVAANDVEKQGIFGKMLKNLQALIVGAK